ncbi:MAG: hypothetical protein AMJ94_00355 [Deltaproteobacteria bacterium SM23_61]|nr:MAG: hypothetical protein AMJ94_00355 [Deltaproteobacteria bacterium SM23_61]
MTPSKLKVVHYLNQFFGQVGQEEKADLPFMVKKGPVGPGMALQKILGEKGEVVGTIICGDNYFADNLEKAAEDGVRLAASFTPELFFAGPAFEAGRYGLSCGAICRKVQERLAIPAITGMFVENPGVELYRRDVYICRTGKSAAKMAEDLTKMVNLAFHILSPERGTRLISGENIIRPEEGDYFPRGLLKNEFTEKTAAARGVDMLLAKIQGKPFLTEAGKVKERAIPPPSPIADLTKAEIALISDGGLTWKGNPDGFRGRGNVVWSKYEIDQFLPQNYSAENYEVVHTGYYPLHVLGNPNRLVPVDAMRDLEKEGLVGKLHPFIYSTSGNANTASVCERIGREMAQDLKSTKVGGVILTST